ncbi:O-antigen ligase family protein [bacterium]|nr:O-antigen ligase family protein [bacterium]
MRITGVFILIILALFIPAISGAGIFIPKSIAFYLPQILIFLALFVLLLKSEISSSFLLYPLVAFAFFSLLSIFWSSDKYLSANESLRIIASLSVFPLALSLSREDTKKVLIALTLSSGFVSLYGISEYLRARFIMGDPTWRIFSTFINPNILAGFLATTIFPILALFLLLEKGNLIIGFLLFAQLIALFLTGSRGGFIAFAGALVFFFIVIIRLKTFPLFLKKAVPLLLLVFLLAYFGEFIKPLGRRVAGGGGVEEAQSGAFRTLLWKSAKEMIKTKPIGWGAGTFELIYPRYAIGGFSRMAHNSYLQFASEIGIQGLLALLCFLFLLAYHIHKRHPDLPKEEALLLGALLSGIFASSLHSLVDYDWQIMANFFTLFLLSGLACSLIELRGKKLGRGLAVFPLLFLIFALDLSISNHYLETAKRSTKVDPWRAEECLKLSLRFAPFNGEARWYLGLMRVKKGDKEGIKLMKESLRLYPYPPNFYQLGKVFLSLGNKKEAERWFRKTVEVDPHSLPAYLALGQLLLEEGKINEAREIFLKILEIENSQYEATKPIAFFKEPAYPIAKLELGKMTLRKNPREAKRIIEEAVKQFEEYLSNYRQWKEVMERFTYVEEKEIEKYLLESKSLLKMLQ